MTKMSSGRLLPPPDPYAMEVDPDVANYQREIDDTGKYYYEIHKLSEWHHDSLYWEDFPPGGSFVLGTASTVSSDTPEPSDVTRFHMGSWKDTGDTTIDAKVGSDDVDSIYQVSGSNSGGSGYLVIKKESGEYKLRWYTSASSTPNSLIASTDDTVTLSSVQSFTATADKGETWWKAKDNPN